MKKLNLDEIRELYKTKTARQIGLIMGCHHQTILRKLKKMDIKLKPRMIYYCMDCKNEINHKNSKRCKKCSDKSHRKEHGVSRDFYNRISKENLKQECSKCGSKKNLCVHHEDGNRRNNELSNLIIFCRSCHAKKHNLKNNLKWDYSRLKAEKRKIIQDIKKIPNMEIPDKFKNIIINKIKLAR